MSRRRADNSTAVSLFPFLAVLLCTMGALLVVLVAVSRAAREAALRQAAADTHAAVEDPEVRRELEKIDQYVANLKALQTTAEQTLREDQSRLSHLEEHMRRLQDQLAALQMAAAELDALEGEHYDDREQAEREIERLQRLIEEARAEIAALRDENRPTKRRYALVPYEGPNGTYRRPIYVECVEDGLILQPEGVRITREDLASPIGPGNALASALRAARDYYAQRNPAEGRTRDAEPYPLLVVRGEGLIMYDRARRAIEAGDFQFGFELVEDDWELQYPVGDPQLAAIERQAIEQARMRQRVLAAAAPRAYRHPALAAAGRFDEDDGFGFVAYGGGAGDGDGGSMGGSAGADGTGAAGPSAETVAGNSDGESTGVAGGATAGDQGTTAKTVAAAGSPDGNAATAPAASNQVSVSAGAPDAQQPTEPSQIEIAATRGKDWALDRKKPNAVPIRRTIQAIAYQDRLVLLPDDAPLDAAPRGKSIPVPGDTVESLDAFVTAIREQIDGWGIAGDGLYWRPVLILHASADGRRRADDLTRLLKDSGLDLRTKELPETK